MSRRELFANFLKIWILTLNRQKRSAITSKNNQVIKSCVQRNEFPGSNRLKVGSVGRHTAIKGISDLTCFILCPPISMNIITVRIMVGCIAYRCQKHFSGRISWPDVKKDRLVVQIIFKNFYVEVQLYSDRMMAALNSLKAIMGEQAHYKTSSRKGGYDRIFAR